MNIMRLERKVNRAEARYRAYRWLQKRREIRLQELKEDLKVCVDRYNEAIEIEAEISI